MHKNPKIQNAIITINYLVQIYAEKNDGKPKIFSLGG